ncbi:MAG TPA: DRTGG domain-containing protein [Acidobacteriota bacterium]|nr:DRTGG domain-containing protein [Acidobacteriota bacterium]
MRVLEAAEAVSGTVVACAAAAAARDVRGGYASDLLSDVMGNACEGDLWVTLQKHVNIVAVAQLKGLAGIILVNGRHPEPDAAARAEEEHIPIVSTDLPTFDVVGILHSLGIQGRRSA